MSRELTPYEKALQLTQQSIKRTSYNAYYTKTPPSLARLVVKAAES
jgi:hypothetical protein